MALDKIRSLAEQIIKEIDNTITPSTPSKPQSAPIADAAALDRALSTAVAGDRIVLSSSLVYNAPLMITQSSLALVGESDRFERMTYDEPAPKFLGGLKIKGSSVRVSGLHVEKTTDLLDVVMISGTHVILDRMRVLGNQSEGSKRGIAANGGDMTISRSYVDHCRRPDQDAQAVCAWDMSTPGLFIEDCYLSGGAQAVMLGGNDPVDALHSPRMIRVKNCYLTKRHEWFTDGTQIKCAFEAKNCDDVEVTDTIMEGAGIDDGQGSFVVVLTPRNQYGKTPYVAVTNVKFERCLGRSAGGCVTFLGRDSNYESGPLKNVSFVNCAFEDIDPKVYKGRGRLFQFEDGPQYVTLDSITVNGRNTGAYGYFTKKSAWPLKLVIRNMKLPEVSTYNWKIDAGGQGLAEVRRLMPDALIEVTSNDRGSVGHPRLVV